VIASEERVNVDRYRLGIPAARVRMVAPAIALLVVAGVILGKVPHPAPFVSGASSASPFHTPSPVTSNDLKPAPPLKARALVSGLPLIFEPNRGQANLDPADSNARFIARGSDYSLLLGSRGALIHLSSRKDSTVRDEAIRMTLAGASANARLSGAEVLPGKSNYLLGNDAAKWRTGIPQFARVRYENVYPGINLVFYGNQGRLEYDFQVAPGSNPAQAELELDGDKELELSRGDLLIRGKNGIARLAAPHAYQETNGRKQPVEAAFVRRGASRVGFEVGAYDHSRELVIDPILTFSSYFGGGGDEHATAVTVDSAGNIYLAGSTTSTNLPVVGTVLQTTLPGVQNVYIAKIQPPQGAVPATLLYMTYLGGTGPDTPAGIAVDGAGNAFVAGTTSSTNFPTTATAYQTAIETNSSGTQHVFVSELDTTASTLKYSSYLSGSGDDIASGMTVDAGGNIYVTGTTTSVETSPTDQFPASNLPNKLPYQSASRLPGQAQFFVTKVNTQAPGNGSVPYSTYFGGSDFNGTLAATGGGIAVDANGNIYFSGTTNFLYTGCAGCSNTDFPILNAYQACLGTAPAGIPTNPASCPVDSTTTASDAFLAKLNPNAAQGQQLQWSSYLGAEGTDTGAGIALDLGAANVYLVGTTNSTKFVLPTTTGAFQSTLGGGNDAYVARFPNLTPGTTVVNLSLGYFSYVGGSGNEAGLAIKADSNNGALITGWTQSSDFPVVPANNEIQSTLNGPQDAFVARINTIATTTTGTNQTASWSSYFGGNNSDEGTSLALDVNQNTYFAGDTNSSANLQLASPLPPNDGGNYNGGFDAFVGELKLAASVSIVGVPTLGTNQQYFSAGNPATFTYTLTNNGPDLATGITVSDNLSSSPVTLTFGSASASAGSCGGLSTNSTVSCTIGALQAGSTATVTIVVTPVPSTSGSAEQFNGGTVQVLGPNNIILATTSVAAQMSDFSIAVNPPNRSVTQAGASTSYQVALTPHPVYGTNITISCSGNPAASTCSPTPGTVTLQGSSPTTATLTISTTARPITTGSLRSRFGGFYAAWLGVPLLGLVAAGSSGKRRRRFLGLMLLCLVLLQLVPLPGCGSTRTTPPSGGTPPGTWPITVTATSGSDTKSQVVQLTVP
jgi:uncharacterized repeat protein (TIGR01451 family)